MSTDRRLETWECPDTGWEYFSKTSYTPEDTDSHWIEKGTLNHLMRCEIILDEMMKAGVHEWADFESCMEAVDKRLKGNEE